MVACDQKRTSLLELRASSRIMTFCKLPYGNFQKVMILELALSSKHDLFCGTNPAKILVGKGPVKI